MAFTFNYHGDLSGRHAFLGASKYHWVNYDDEKLLSAYDSFTAAERGTRLHAFAAEAIKLGVKLSDTKSTIGMYVNDAIGFGMQPEQPLYYSDNCFGTADAISFKKNTLRIHDLKTGTTPVSAYQLMIYEALFCLEYHVKPNAIKAELRIYQNGDKLIISPEPAEIQMIMDKIIHFDKLIFDRKRGVL